MNSPRSSDPAAQRRSPGRSLDYRALAEFRHQLRCFLVFSEEQARVAGIEPQQHQLLLALRGLPEGLRPTIGTVAGRLALKHHTTVGLVDRLARTGLIERRPSSEDRREILLAITPRGERMLDRLSAAHQTELLARGPALVATLEHLIRKSSGSSAKKG